MIEDFSSVFVSSWSGRGYKIETAIYIPLQTDELVNGIDLDISL